MTNSKIAKLKCINLSVITLMGPMIERFPILKDILRNSKNIASADDWNFYMMAAISGLLLISEDTIVLENDEAKIWISELYPGILPFIEDFITFMMQADRNNNFNYFSSTGLWVLWNIKHTEPSYEEMQELAPAIGNILFRYLNEFEA